jgi:hypothetical protein
LTLLTGMILLLGLPGIAATGFLPGTPSALAIDDPIPVSSIEDFVAVNIEGNIWVISGRVANTPQQSGLQVDFGGLAEGESTTTAADGSFTLSIIVPPNTEGDVSAVVTMPDGTTIGPAIYIIFNAGE